MPDIIGRTKYGFGSLWRSLRSYILMRRERNGEKPKMDPHCEIQCDLSDKRTFFAWQRNHMANERTFLAWCRTGIALIVFGFVIERFDILIRELQAVSPLPEMHRHVPRTHYVGLTTFLLGAVIMILAGWRFFYIRKRINQGETDFSPVPDVFLMSSVLATVAMIFLLFVFLF